MARATGVLRTLKKSARKSYVDETDYLLRSPANARELLAAIAEADAGKFEEHELIDE
jgi:PHD/YefM family antitoxin component YafN of YafNO toxin-antitoxin module